MLFTSLWILFFYVFNLERISEVGGNVLEKSFGKLVSFGYPFLVTDTCGHKGTIFVCRVCQKHYLLTSCCLLGCFEFHQPLLLINSFEFSRKLRSPRFFLKGKGVVSLCKKLYSVKLQGGMDLIRYWICIDLANGIEFYTLSFWDFSVTNNSMFIMMDICLGSFEVIQV